MPHLEKIHCNFKGIHQKLKEKAVNVKTVWNLNRFDEQERFKRLRFSHLKSSSRKSLAAPFFVQRTKRKKKTTSRRHSLQLAQFKKFYKKKKELKMGKPEVKGTMTSLSSMFPAEEAQKAAIRVEETLSEKQNEMNQLIEFISDNTSLINLVQKLPDELHHDIMASISLSIYSQSILLVIFMLIIFLPFLKN